MYLLKRKIVMNNINSNASKELLCAKNGIHYYTVRVSTINLIEMLHEVVMTQRK